MNRPDSEQFDTISVGEYFEDYEMRLLSSLTMCQKENLESDNEENSFFKFNIMFGENEKVRKSNAVLQR